MNSAEQKNRQSTKLHPSSLGPLRTMQLLSLASTRSLLYAERCQPLGDLQMLRMNVGRQPAVHSSLTIAHAPSIEPPSIRSSIALVAPDTKKLGISTLPSLLAQAGTRASAAEREGMSVTNTVGLPIEDTETRRTITTEGVEAANKRHPAKVRKRRRAIAALMRLAVQLVLFV